MVDHEMLVWLAAAALAESPNWVVLAHLDVIHAFGSDHPWGARLGADLQFAIGDSCDQEWPGWESECHTSPLWPVAGSGLSVAWRGGDRFFFEVDGLGGVAGAEVYTHGWLPRWEVAARFGFRFRTARPGAGLVLGGHLSKSFGITLPDGETWGAHGFGLRFDTDAVLRLGDDGWDGVVLGGGLWSFASPVYTEILL